MQAYFIKQNCFFFRLIHSLREVCQKKVFNDSHSAFIWKNTIAKKESKYGVISVTYFPVFGMNTERYFVSLRLSPNAGKYRPEITPYLGIFHAVHGSEKIHVLAYFTQWLLHDLSLLLSISLLTTYFDLHRKIMELKSAKTYEDI